jgi:hypothetical protein
MANVSGRKGLLDLLGVLRLLGLLVFLMLVRMALESDRWRVVRLCVCRMKGRRRVGKLVARSRRTARRVGIHVSLERMERD